MMIENNKEKRLIVKAVSWLEAFDEERVQEENLWSMDPSRLAFVKSLCVHDYLKKNLAEYKVISYNHSADVIISVPLASAQIAFFLLKFEKKIFQMGA